MRKRLIAAEAIEAGDTLTCVGVDAGPGPGGFDFRIGVIRPGLRDYVLGPLGCAEAAYAAGDVMREEAVLDLVPGLVVRPTTARRSAPVRSTPVAEGGIPAYSGPIRCVYCGRTLRPVPDDYCCPERQNRVRLTLALQDRPVESVTRESSS